MMIRPPNRHSLILAAGLLGASAATVTGIAAAQSAEISGSVTFLDQAEIPKGQIAIYLEDPAAENNSRSEAARMQIESDGGSKAIPFSLTLPADTRTSSTLTVVARLEREDGWLLARGSAQVERETPVEVVLSTVMY